MPRLIERPAFRRLATACLAIVSLGALTAMSNPAEARIWVNFGFGPGYYAPYYGPYYRPYYYRPYPVYYGWRWRHRHWCYWHPYRCYY